MWYGLNAGCEHYNSWGANWVGSLMEHTPSNRNLQSLRNSVVNNRNSGLETGDCVRNVWSKDPVAQSTYSFRQICGRRGGKNFIEVQRPDVSGHCPNGTSPCSTKTTPENTVCYPLEDHESSCPITQIKFVT